MPRKIKIVKNLGKKTSTEDIFQLRIDKPPAEGAILDQTSPPTIDSINDQSPLLTLPLEVRIEIYKHVLATGDIHEESGSPLLCISLRRHLRLTSSKSRINHYRLDNISLKYFALSRTCKQIRREIEDCMPKPALQFSGCGAFSEFLGNHWDVVDMPGPSSADKVLEEAPAVIVLGCPALSRNN